MGKGLVVVVVVVETDVEVEAFRISCFAKQKTNSIIPIEIVSGRAVTN